MSYETDFLKNNITCKGEQNFKNNFYSPFLESMIDICFNKNNYLKTRTETYNNTLPNNREDNPIFIEPKKNHLNSNEQTSNFSNFNNYKTILNNQLRQKSKYFDVYYPKKLNSLNCSLSDSNGLNVSHKEDIGQYIKKELEINSDLDCQKDKENDVINKFDLEANPVQFNMDKVIYVKTLEKAKPIVDLILEKSQIIALNCDSDCFLQNKIDLLEVAVTLDMTLNHPDIYIFDIYLEPSIIELFKPVFATSKIIKVMFDARFDLRILCRKYNVTCFVALFDLQLAYRVLFSKMTKRSFDQVKREKLLYVSWQCNGPLINFEKLHLPGLFYFKNKPFWTVRPMNFEIMYSAAYDVFVMVPQLFSNLVVIMERSLNDSYKKLFLKQSNDLISRNLVSRKFAFFKTKHEYLTELHKQVDLLIQSDIIYRNRQSAKWSEYNKKDDEKTENFDKDELKKEKLLNDLKTENLETSLTEKTVCKECHLSLKNENTLNKLLKNLQTNKFQNLFTDKKYCKCNKEEEAKCMNLLVDQIIDLTESREDYMDLDE